MGDPGHIALRCPDCGRQGAVTVADMIDHCWRRGLRTDWALVAGLFRCSACGRRPVQVHFAHGAEPVPYIRPPSLGVPKGISPRAWHAANQHERRRLIRQARG